jgi:cation diffusion facilitator family transporter
MKSAGPGVPRIFLSPGEAKMNRETKLSNSKTAFFRTKQGVAILSIAAISVLIIIKLVASFITGSISIRADAIHSFIDLSGAIIGLIGIRVAIKPPDEKHAFGHGKAESIAGVFIASIIFVAAGTICYQAIQRLVSGGAVEMITFGIYIIAASIIINAVISWYALKVARKSDSMALEATARDMFADVLSSIAVLIGLILVRFTGRVVLDSIVALLITAVIAFTAFKTMKKSIGGLMDTKLSDDEENAIISSVTKYGCMVVGYHKLRTRKAGSESHVDLHLTMAKSLTLAEAHVVCNQIEDELQSTLPNANVMIHCEPCGDQCMECTVICAERITT